MNLNLQTNACDPDQLESFLSGDLSDVEEREFTLHLNTCENCRRSLQQQAAEPEAWMEAEKLLRLAEFDAHDADEIAGSESLTPCTRQPLQIQNVLAALGPTDDPAMLGRLGGYEVSGVVGAGGMGVVLKAIDKSLDRTVAIKVLAPHLATSGAARKRFAREAKAAAAVLHPNVIAIHSVSNDESLPYLVMPYVRGTSLQKRLDREGPLSLQEILRIGSQIAAGLAAAHAQGLVHRDIKPANILLEDGVERVTITDFGLARAVDDATITHSGVIAGTPQYMSPEQARGEAVDGRSDLFSLGSVLYAICAGRPPFRAETTYGVMRRITDDEPTSIHQINPDIPAWLCSIIAKLMSKQASHRFASATEVSELLEKCLAHVQQPAAVPLPQSCLSLRERSDPFAERKATILSRFFSFSRLSLGAIAMIAALGLGLLGMVLWQASEAPDIAGKWTGEGWGEVVLEKKQPGEYEGTYTDTFRDKPGTMAVKWSRLERRFNGTWREGKERHGKISVRLVDDEIRGAWTANKESKIDPERPRLADLAWRRSQGQESLEKRPEVLNSVQADETRRFSGSEHEKAAAKLVLVFFQDKSRRAVPCLVVNVSGNTLVVTAGPATIVPEGTVHAIACTFVELAGKPPILVEFDPHSSLELYVCRAKDDLNAIQLKDTASVAINDSVSAIDVPHPAPRQATVVGVNRQAKYELREHNIKHQFENLIEVDQSFPEGTPLYKDGKLAGITLLGSRFVGERANKSYVVPAKRLIDLCARFEQEVQGVAKPQAMKGAPPSRVGSGDQTERPAKLEGIVMGLQKDQELVEISIGADDGVRARDTLNVFRDNTYLGKITVTHVAADKSVARVDSRQGEIRVDDRVSSKSEDEVLGTPDSSLKGVELGFSETKEFVLSMGSSKFMLDLDTGKTMDPPQTPRPEQKLMDVHTDQVQPYHYPKELVGVALEGREVKESDWDASAAEVRRALAGDLVGPLKQMDLGPEEHPTYFFKTRDGAHGVLQLLGLVDDPKGIRLRYKTVEIVPATLPGDANIHQAELVMNLGFERNGFGSLASVSPVLLQKGQIVPASEFRAYLEREKLSLIRQHGDAATKATTIRLHVDRDVRFDAVTALMKLCQEVGFQKFALRLEEEAVEKFVLEILRTPFNPDPAKGSWQGGAYEMQILMSLNMVQPRDRAVKTLLKVVDRSEKGTMDQRRLAMMSLGGMAPKQVLPLLIKELTGATHLPVGQFRTSFPYHEIAVLEQIGEEAKDAIPILIKHLDSPDGLARQSALLALVKIGPSSDEVMNAIAGRFGKPAEPVWSRAVYEVGRYGKQARPHGPTFVKLLSAKPREARIWAAQALVKSGFDEALGFETLIGDVAKGESADRGLAATALAALGSQAEPMIPKLRAFENDPDAHVAKEVRDAIRRIEKDDRIFTHAEEAAKNAASRKASAEALEQISAETKAIFSEAEYQRFEGTWRISLRTIDRAVSLGEFGKDGKHVIKDRQMGDARISLDPSKTPGEIDIAFTKGPDKGKVLRGIYEWVDDARGTKLVRISVSTNLTEPGEDANHRPKNFEERAGVDFAVWEQTKAGGFPGGLLPKEAPRTDDATELKKFQGTWVLVSSEKDGEEKSEAKNPYALTFTGTHWKVHHGDEVAIEGTLKLVDVTSTPMKFDLLKPKGLGPDPTVDYGIYEWKENSLRYCVRNGPVGGGFPGGMDISKLRPTEFATKNGDGRILYVWMRAESAQPSATAQPDEHSPNAASHVEESTRSTKSQKSAPPKWARHLGTVEGLKSIAYSPDGKLVAVANGNVSFPVAEGWKRAVVILNAETGNTVVSLPLATKEENAILAATEGLPHFEVGPLAFSPDGTLLAVGTGLGQVKLINPKTGELVGSLDDEPAKLAEKKTPENLKSLRRAMGGVGTLAFSPDGSLLAMTGSSFEDVARNWGDVRELGRLGTGPGRLKVWEVKTGTLKHDLVGHSHADAVSFSADGNLLASSGRWGGDRDNGTGVIIWNALTGKKMTTILQEANSGTHAVVFSPTNKLVAIGSRQYDKENDTYTTAVSVTYALSGITQWKRTFPGWANPKAFSPDGKTVVVLCGGESIQFIKTETGEVQREIKCADFLPATPRQGSQWFDFAISPTGPRLAIGGVDKERKGTVEIWDFGDLDAAANPAPAKQ